MKLFGYKIQKAPKVIKNIARSFKRAQRYVSLRFGRSGFVVANDDDARFFTQEGYRLNPVVGGITSQIAHAASRAVWTVCDKDGKEVKVPMLNAPGPDGVMGILQRPNPTETLRELVASAITHDVLDGNMFIQKELMPSGRPASMSVLPTDGMEIHGDKLNKSISGYSLDYKQDDTFIPVDQMLHIKEAQPNWYSLEHSLFGQSLYRSAETAIRTFNKSQDAGFHYLDNKGAGKLVFNKDTNYYEDLGADTQDQNISEDRSKKQGVENTGNNLEILEGYDLGVINVASDPKEALVLEQRIQCATEICGALGFPPFLLGINNATYQNAKEAKKGLWENCVIPRLDKLEAGFQWFIVDSFGEGLYIKYNIDHIDAIQEDKLFRGKAIKEFAGMITINEARVKAGLQPFPWMEDPETMEQFEEVMYVGFTQAVISDTEDTSTTNND